jgi:hypothetical protein
MYIRCAFALCAIARVHVHLAAVVSGVLAVLAAVRRASLQALACPWVKVKSEPSSFDGAAQ